MEAGKLIMITLEYSVENNATTMFISPAKFSPNNSAGRVVNHTNTIAPAINVTRIILRAVSNSITNIPHRRLADKTSR